MYYKQKYLSLQDVSNDNNKGHILFQIITIVGPFLTQFHFARAKKGIKGLFLTIPSFENKKTNRFHDWSYGVDWSKYFL